MNKTQLFNLLGGVGAVVSNKDIEHAIARLKYPSHTYVYHIYPEIHRYSNSLYGTWGYGNWTRPSRRDSRWLRKIAPARWEICTLAQFYDYHELYITPDGSTRVRGNFLEYLVELLNHNRYDHVMNIVLLNEHLFSKEAINLAKSYTAQKVMDHSKFKPTTFDNMMLSIIDGSLWHKFYAIGFFKIVSGKLPAIPR